MITAIHVVPGGDVLRVAVAVQAVPGKADRHLLAQRQVDRSAEAHIVVVAELGADFAARGLKCKAMLSVGHETGGDGVPSRVAGGGPSPVAQFAE